MVQSCPAAALLTTVAAVGTGDELLRPLVAVLLLGPQAEAADRDRLRHRLHYRGEERENPGCQLALSRINCANVAQVCVCVRSKCAMG